MTMELLSPADREYQLLQAAFCGSLDMVRSLLTKDNINSRDAIGRTPLSLACWGAHYAVAEYLLKAGADISGHFRQVSSLKHARIVELLLTYGANVNEEYTDGQRPLHHACERDNLEVVKVLLEHGADANLKDSFGKTPLHYTCSRGNGRIAKLLLQHRANIDTTDANMRTPLHYSCCHQHREVVQILLENRADVFSFDSQGCSSFNLCSNHCDIMSILLDYSSGAPVPCRRHNGQCNRNVLMCRYFELKELNDSLLVNVFEQHFVKAHEVGLLNENIIEANILKSLLHGNSYRDKCSRELTKMKVEAVGDTSATYYNVLSHDLSHLRNQPPLNLMPDDCRSKFPIYGNIIFSQFLKIKRYLLLDVCSVIFMVAPPQLPRECVDYVLSYLPDEDLCNVAKACA